MAGNEVANPRYHTGCVITTNEIRKVNKMCKKKLLHKNLLYHANSITDKN